MKRTSTTYYVLSALVPYTESNTALSFKPATFFKELAKRHGAQEQVVRNAYQRAMQKDLILRSENGLPQLTAKGQRQLAPFHAKSLPNAELMVIFDIPEEAAAKRQRFRRYLREFEFVQIQKSVWTTHLDCTQYIKQAAEELKITEYVRLFESKNIPLK